MSRFEGPDENREVEGMLDLEDQAGSARDGAFDAFTKSELRLAIDRTTAELEEQFLAGLMQRCGGNISAAARASGIHRSHLQKMLARHRPRR